jgi:hypothetical protein
LRKKKDQSFSPIYAIQKSDAFLAKETKESVFLNKASSVNRETQVTKICPKVHWSHATTISGLT